MYMKNIVYIRFIITHGLKLSTGGSQNIFPAGKETTVMLGHVNSMPTYPVVQTLGVIIEPFPSQPTLNPI